MDYDVSHIEDLHDLGYLPIQVKIITEGELLPVKIPVLTICNTDKKFFWITNFLETIISNMLWKPMTSATIARQYRKVLSLWQQKTDREKGWFLDWQAHDFSMRGLDSVQAAIASGLGHATSFLGSDTVPVIHGARQYYGETGVVIGSVNATEHSIQSASTIFNEDGSTDELEGIKVLLEKYPSGIFSMVSDTFDLWRMCVEYLPKLKDMVMAREGKLVIRPDSSDPVEIVCGAEIKDYTKYGSLQGALNEAARDLVYQVENDTPHGECGNYTPTRLFKYESKCYKLKVEIEWNRYDKQYYYVDGWKVTSCSEHTLAPNEVGVVELLWNVFGGEINDQGYKVLDSHIGCIYGDSITLDRANRICKRLEAKGFASTNVVFGVGSFTFQYNTRDTLGLACKATYCEINGAGKMLYKDPITDDGMKKSARGLLKVVKDEAGEYKLIDSVSKEEEQEGELKLLYKNGEFFNLTTLTEIRNKLKQ
jgi:nicotinamide phosphoribosyltransferase